MPWPCGRPVGAAAAAVLEKEPERDVEVPAAGCWFGGWLGACRSCGWALVGREMLALAGGVGAMAEESWWWP